MPIDKIEPLPEITPSPKIKSIDMEVLNELMDSIPLYKHFQPQTKEYYFDLWKQEIRSIIRDQIQDQITKNLEVYRKQFQQFIQEIHHCKQYEQEVYRDWKEIIEKLEDIEKKQQDIEEKQKKIDEKYQTLLFVLREAKDSWTKNFEI